MVTLIWVAVFLALATLVDIGQAEMKPPCKAEGLVRYNVTFHALWSKQDFPKQYPLFRPPAQWTKMIGRAHSQYFVLWRKGTKASPALKKFVELGQSTLLEKQTQGKGGIVDDFSLPAISSGTGTASATFFLNSWHPKVSMIAKIVPSPDWFVGVDSLDLCKGEKWLEELSVDLNPFDAGTDQGYTFTAPNWSENPPKPVIEITSQKPNHPANSFFYPERKTNPPIGRLVFSRLTTFNYNEGDDGQEEYQNEAREYRENQEEKQLEDDSGDIGVQENKVGGDLGLLKGFSRTAQADGMAPFFRTISSLGGSPPRPSLTQAKISSSGDERDEVKVKMPTKHIKSKKHHKNRRTKNRKNDKRKFQSKRVDCQVSPWSDWGPCSKTCGFGLRTRTRDVIRKPANYGQPCPLLREEETCGSMRTCKWSHFSSWSLT